MALTTKNFDVTIESSLPVVQQNGLNTKKNVNFEGTLDVGGATSFAVAPTGPQNSTAVINALVGATVVLTAAQSGSTLFNRSTSGSPSFTLPASANGLKFTFVVTSTSAGFTITTGTTSVIHAKTTATGTAITSTATTGAITNTQGTAVVGDTITLQCDGTDWWMTAQSGIFAAS